MDHSGGGKRTAAFGLGTFLLALIRMVQTEWIAFTIIIIERCCSHRLGTLEQGALRAQPELHTILAIVIAVPFAVEPDTIVSWWRQDMDGVVSVVAWWPTPLA